VREQDTKYPLHALLPLFAIETRKCGFIDNVGKKPIHVLRQPTFNLSYKATNSERTRFYNDDLYDTATVANFCCADLQQ